MEESLKKKIQKLLALQEGANKIGSIEEAANAAAKIRAMLMKHNLDLYSIQQEGKEETIDKRIVYPSELSSKVEGDWVSLLIGVIAKHHLCEAVSSGGARGFVYIVGKPSNAEIVYYTIEQLINRIRPMAKQAFKEYQGLEKRNTFLRGFYRGAVTGINAQLAEQAAREKYQADKDAQDNLIGTTALMTQSMVTRNQRDLRDYMESTFRLGKGRSSSLSSSSGRAQGYTAGKSMNINAGVKGGSTKATKFLG